MRIHKSIILPVVLYGCKTWSLALREEHRLRVFENKVLRRLFGRKRDEVTGRWRKLHNEDVGGHGEKEKCVQVIGGKARGKDTTRKMKT
jgi:hypothetical protein